MLKEKKSINELFKNINDYDIKCKCITLMPLVEFYEKNTEKLVYSTKASMKIYNGTMKTKYTDEFFKDVVDAVKISLIQEAKKYGKII